MRLVKELSAKLPLSTGQPPALLDLYRSVPSLEILVSGNSLRTRGLDLDRYPPPQAAPKPDSDAVITTLVLGPCCR